MRRRARASSRPRRYRTRARYATCSCSCPASAGFATPQHALEAASGRKATSCCRSTRGSRRARQRNDSRRRASAPRIVLATNVAETSLTVPRIRYVVDSGLGARRAVTVRGTACRAWASSRSRKRTRSSAPAAAAASRPALACGCTRKRISRRVPQFTRARDPAHGLGRRPPAARGARASGRSTSFPFIDAPPDEGRRGRVSAAALARTRIDDERRAHDGRRRSWRGLPVDPRVARLAASSRISNDALREGLVIAAALSVVDPREHRRRTADAARRQVTRCSPTRARSSSTLSESCGTAYRRERRGGERALRAWCQGALSRRPRGLREWHDVHDQLARARARPAAGARASRPPTIGRFIRPCSRRSSISSRSTTTALAYSRHARVARAALRRARRSRRSGRAGSWPPSASRRSGSTCAPSRRSNPRWALRVGAAPRDALRARRPAVGRASVAKSRRARSSRCSA